MSRDLGRWAADRMRFGLLLSVAATVSCGDAGTDVPTGYGQSSRQGQLLWTGRAMDLALEGPGLFAVGEGSDRRFVRGGRFRLDSQTGLVDEDGRALQGYGLSDVTAADGLVANAALHSIVIDPTAPPRATTAITFEGNLDVHAQLVPSFDPSNPGPTSSFVTASAVFDTNGESHWVTVYFARTGTNRWSWHAIVEDPTDVEPAYVLQGAHGGTGELLFDESGALVGSGGGDAAWSFPLAMGEQHIRLSFAPGLRQVAADSQMRVTADGGPGDRSVVGVLPDGTLRVSQLASVWTWDRVPIVEFANFGGLESTEPGVFAATSASGPAQAGVAGDGGRGTVVAGAIELPAP